MRFETHHVSAQLVHALNYSGAVREIVDDGGDIILLELRGGESVMVYLIESPIPLYEIRNIFTANSEKSLHTLFILWSDLLLPSHGRIYIPEDWHQGLMAAYGDKIYGYEVYRSHVYIYPVHFYPIGSAPHRRIVHGEPVEIGTIGCATIETQHPDLIGTWWVAAFAEGRQPDETEARTLEGTLATYYRLLNVAESADRETIKSVYRDLARRYHPDLNNAPDANARMQAINHAYTVIMQTFEETS